MMTQWLVALEMGLIYSIVALGVYLTFKVIDFPDMSCDGTFVLGACATAALLEQGIPALPATLGGVVTSMAAGWMTGVLSQRLRIQPLLSGILVAFMLYSINLRVLGGKANVALFNLPTVFSYPWPAWITLSLITLGCVGIVSYLLITPWGLGVRSVGCNPTLAFQNGICLKKTRYLLLAISNGCIGLAGSLFAQYQQVADLSQGFGTLVSGLAAIIIGEKLGISAPWAGPWLCLMGATAHRLMIAAALNFSAFGLKSQDLNLITGGMIILFLAVPGWLSKQKNKALTC